MSYQPHRWAKNAHLETIISILHKPKQLHPLQRRAQERLLELPDGVKLQGFYTAPPGRLTKGVVMLIHGWLGSADSNYVIVVAQQLYERGYAVFRLNLRDHGETLHLNAIPFRSDMLDEVFAATQQVAKLHPDLPFYMVGASLGGNFVTRLAYRAIEQPITNLAHTVAFNPAINPNQATKAIDNSLYGFYRHYFRGRWRRYYQEKQTLFPNYDFSPIIAQRNCWDMTEQFIRMCSPYPDAQTYFESYTVTPTMLQHLNAPLTIITSADDPIIPVADFKPFRQLKQPHFRLHILPHGGHVGFMDIFPLRHRIAELVMAAIEPTTTRFI